MSQRERNRGRETATAPPVPGDTGSGGDDLARAQRLFAASEAAIERALSGDSERFLADHRQQGGE